MSTQLYFNNLPFVEPFQVLNLFTLPEIHFSIIDFRSPDLFLKESIRYSKNFPYSKTNLEQNIRTQLFSIFRGYSKYLYKSRKLLAIVLVSNKGEEALLEPIQLSLEEDNYENVFILNGGFESFATKYPWLCEGDLSLFDLRSENNKKTKGFLNTNNKNNMNLNYNFSQNENNMDLENYNDNDNGNEKEKEQEQENLGKQKQNYFSRGFLKQRKIKKKNYHGTKQIVKCKHPSEVVPDFLWLGSLRTANNENILKILKIKRIINLAIEVEEEKSLDLDLYSKLGIEHLSIPFDDQVNIDIIKIVDQVADLINGNDSKILVHCRLGISRSSAVIIYYLMKYHNLSYQQAYEWVKYCRSLIDPNTGFVNQLIDLEKQLFN
ncbi:dual-specificity protein phosphatase sdp1-related [Anaeramoeba flamelloides]|uniref:protein-tyrosine-phosphatase n=1 Tax=Anaeramoeba flamelloides TaxID=1746091 RepID=A0ABQ8YYD4_9EUKA|nr:dual-specificity protein phosphatase sdp1-related [Anaeramoeba flamelloides]